MDTVWGRGEDNSIKLLLSPFEKKFYHKRNGFAPIFRFWSRTLFKREFVCRNADRKSQMFPLTKNDRKSTKCNTAF